MKYYTSKEVAEKLRYKLNTVQKKIKSGEIVAVKVGKEYHIAESEMIRILGIYLNEPLYTPQEAADRLGCNVWTVRVMAQKGEIKSLQLGSTVGVRRIPVSEVERILDERND